MKTRLSITVSLEADIACRFLQMCHRDGVEASEVVQELISCLAWGEPCGWATEDPAREFYRAFTDTINEGAKIGFGRWLERYGELDAVQDMLADVQDAKEVLKDLEAEKQDTGEDDPDITFQWEKIEGVELELKKLYDEYMKQTESHQGMTFEGALADLYAYLADKDELSCELEGIPDEMTAKRAVGGRDQALRLQKAMLQAGATLAEMADILGLSDSDFIKRMYRMDDEFTVDELERIAERLHLDGNAINHIFFDV